jgi:hypothetical protein
MALTLSGGGQGGVFTLRGRSFGGSFTTSTTPIDSDVQAFFSRVTTAGGTLSATEQTAVNTLVVSMKSAGIWTAMKAIYPMVGASAAACAQNLKSSSYTGTFTSGWTFASTGATPNGTSAYMQTNFSFKFTTADYNNHLSMYSRTQNSSVSGFNLGCQEVLGGPQIGLYQYYADVSQKGGTFYEYPTTSPLINNTNTLGYQIVSRTTQTDARLYFNNSLLATNTTSPAIGFTQPNKTIILAAMQRPSTIQEFTPHENAFTTFGDGLNGTEASNLYTAVQAFQTSLSRQV